MDRQRKELLIDQLISGISYFFHCGRLYSFHPILSSEKYLAKLAYNSFIEEYIYDSFLKEEQRISIISKKNIWTQQHEELYSTIDKRIQELQREIYKKFNIPPDVKRIEKALDIERKKKHKLAEAKNTLIQYTFEDLADKYRQKIEVLFRLRDHNGNRVYAYNSMEKVDQDLLEAALMHFYTTFPKLEEIKEIARTNPWRNLWNTAKDSAIENDPSSWTDGQQLLVYYSRMYDNVYEHPESPPDHVINHDDMLDGWFLDQQDKRTKESNKKFGHKHEVRAGGHEEIMFMANNHSEAKNVLETNDIQTQMDIKNRSKLLHEKGVVKEIQMPDVQTRVKTEILGKGKK